MRFNDFKYLFFVIIPIVISACGIVTFYGKSPYTIKEDIHKTIIYWNAFSDENAINIKLNTRIKETLVSKGSSDFEILYQSNNTLEFGRRIYIIKYFKSERDKSIFLNPSAAVLNQLEEDLKSSCFNERWSKLKKNLGVEDVFLLFPELTKYKFNQTFLMDYTRLEYRNIEFVFSKRGKLMSFKK